MAGLRGLVVGLALGSAIMSVPARAQLGASASLTHTVSVTVPPRVKVKVASLAFPAPLPASVASSQVSVGGLSLTINASQAWVLAVGSVSTSQLQWSNGSSDFSTITPTGAAVASSVTGYEAKAATLMFRNGASSLGGGSSEPIVLTVSAP